MQVMSDIYILARIVILYHSSDQSIPAPFIWQMIYQYDVDAWVYRSTCMSMSLHVHLKFFRELRIYSFSSVNSLSLRTPSSDSFLRRSRSSRQLRRRWESFIGDILECASDSNKLCPEIKIKYPSLNHNYKNT